jgi:hypothetical protein
LKYCIDTSGLTFGWRHHYPPDIYPSLWRDIEGAINDGTLIAPDEVLEELKRGGDDLYDWVRTKNGFFVPHDADVQAAVSAILADPEHAKLLYTQNATGIVIADPFVIAAAQVHSCAVISNETLMLNPSPRKTKIPNVCAALGVPHVSLLEFIRAQGWKY